MRLEKIKLSGFKSFVDPTTVEFPSNLVGVIGPNGCGKSNIIDAIRWVLGESSAKMLRGESMTDVIFNGSTERKPVGVAMVELVFDNSDGKVGGEYAAYAQISIRREVNRESQSNYFLNNVRCGRKDIFNAFYGTGLGARSYSVIEQGMISRFIEAKPEELRIYLEEVAGISKYKARRKETETRINHTRENLARLTDIRDELEKQLSTLSRQAEAAERYKVLKEEERVLKAQLSVLHWRQSDVKFRELDLTLQERANQQEAKKANLQKIETDIEETRQQQLYFTDEFQSAQQKYYAIGSEVTRIEQAINHHKERKQKLLEDQQQLESDYQGTQDHLADDKDQVAELEQEIQTLTPALESSEQQLMMAEEVLSSAEIDMQQWQQQWDDFNHKASVVVQAVKVEKTKIDHLQSKIHSLRDQLIRYEAQLEQIDLNALSEQIIELEGKLELTLAEQSQAQLDLQLLADNLREKQHQEESLKSELDRAYEQQRQFSSRYATLNALQQAALGQSSKRIQDWLESHNLKNNPRLLQTLDVENGWEKAVETVLGDYIEAICVEDVGDVVQGFAELREGNILLLEKDATLSGAIQADTLASKVSSQWPIQKQLLSVKIASDLAQALQIRKSLAEHESIITAEGIWVGKNWLRVSRANKTQGNVIERKKEIEKLETDLALLNATIEELQVTVKTVKADIQGLSIDKNTLQERNMAFSVKVAEYQSVLKADQKKLTEDQRKQQQLSQEIERAATLVETSEQDLSIAQQTYEEAVIANQEDESSRVELSSRREVLRQAVISRKQEVTDISRAFHDNQIRLQTCKSQFDTINQNIERLEDRLTDLVERRGQLELAISVGEDPSRSLEEELKDKLTGHIDAENKMKQLRLQVEEVTERMARLEQARLTEEAQISASRDAVEQVKLDMQTFKVRSQTIIEQLQEMQFNLETLNQELGNDATVEGWQEQLSKVENRIVRLGAINLAAADEYKTQSERKTYLDAQNEDLTKALDILEDAIRKIDKETKARFQETFDTVNNTFKELFPKVFGGGSAYLELLDDDLLSTGVAVFARPPGKKNSTIHLLSGGEKALTAVALVFAIFKLNPAPFCLLDEVDAPLDDVNLLRYCGLVKEMSKSVQFIFVTHNKIAMEMAEQLMGVTMHEPGVSRIVTVDVQQAVEMAEA